MQVKSFIEFSKSKTETKIKMFNLYYRLLKGNTLKLNITTPRKMSSRSSGSGVEPPLLENIRRKIE